MAHKHTEVYKVGLKVCQILIKPSKSCQTFLFFLPKWRNFAKSGHTEEEGEKLLQRLPKPNTNTTELEEGIWEGLFAAAENLFIKAASRMCLSFFHLLLLASAKTFK